MTLPAPSSTSFISPPSTITSPNLVLTPLTPEDVPALYELAKLEDNAVYKWLPYGPFDTLADYSAFVDRAFFKDRAVQAFVIWEKATNERIGHIALMAMVPEQRRLEIGHIWLAPLPSLRRRGLASEAAYLLIRLSFEMAEQGIGFPVQRCEWKAHSENIPSHKTAEGLGFVREGIFKKHMFVRGQVRDTVYFAITDDEWPAVREKNTARFGFVDDKKN
ncbi:hypothetical protein HDU86_002396 [Geranomyces michiganensis]|nr:hypothetical protein HDU86_002396 [Geranomyces michiganensis]